MVAVPAFVSVVCVVRNQGVSLNRWLTAGVAQLSEIAADFELIVVDNASTDDSIAILQRLTSESGLPNLQVYGLTQEVSWETAAWAGAEGALGDFVAVLDPLTDDLSALPAMLDHALLGACLLYTSPSPRDRTRSRMPSSA